jgi:ketosteroid isomerase-like protein
MKKLSLTLTILFASLVVGLTVTHPSRASSTDQNVAATLKQLTVDWANAIVARDANKLNQIIADDWRGVGYAGKISDKQRILGIVQETNYKLDSYEFGPIDVKVLGDVAVIQGSITEHSTEDGQPHVFHGAWMDVFEKRGDNWVVVRSQSAKLP